MNQAQTRTFGSKLEGAGLGAQEQAVLAAAGKRWGWEGECYLEGRTDSGLDWFALASGGEASLPGAVHRLAREGNEIKRTKPDTMTDHANESLSEALERSIAAAAHLPTRDAATGRAPQARAGVDCV